MDQVKIGKFIQDLRKQKKLTQRDLAEKLGVSNRAVSKWESGISMPDLSLFKPLCDELGITINELYNGEKDTNKIPDDNIINTIKIADKKYTTDVVGYLVYKILGIALIVFGYCYINVDGIFPTLCLVIGAVFGIISSFRLTNSLKKLYKVITNIIYIILWVSIIFIVDDINIVENEAKPRLYLYHNKTEYYEVYYKFNYEYYYCGVNNKLFNYFKHNKNDLRKDTINDCKNINI